jgi:hypothetical protein
MILKENYVFLNDIDFSNEKIMQLDLSKTTIYSMNFKVHQYLESLSIEHEIGEDALDETDLNLIFDTTVRMYRWYDHDSISQKLKFKDRNILGMMDDTEFHTFLIIKLYELRIIQKILKNEVPNTIYANKEIINFIKKIINRKIKFVEIGKSIKETMLYNKIEIKFNLRKIPISFKISRNYYLKIKSIIENIVCTSNNLWVDMSKLKESILLLEINPSVYSELLLELSKSDKQVVLLNNRRSAIWNLNSISILKKSNSKVLSLDHILNKKELQNIYDHESKFQKILDDMLIDEKISELFLIDKITFWDEIKFELIDTFRHRLQWYMKLICTSKKFIDNSNIHSVLSLNVIGETEKSILNQISKPINSVMLEHAFANYTNEISRYDILSNYTIFPDKIAVWGNVQKNYLSNTHNISDDKIIVCGSPRHDSFFKLSSTSIDSKEKIILLCPRPIVEPAARHHTRMYIKYEYNLRKIISELNKIKNCKLIVKLHPGNIDHNNLIKNIVNEINPNIVVFHTKSIDKLIIKSNLVLVISPDGFDPSTVILESIILQKPIINFILDKKFYNFSFEQHNAVISITENDDVKEIILNIFNDSKFRNNLISNGKIFLDDYLSNHQHAAKTLAKKLLKL